ncbi:MAG: TraR/DksA family transcriptional regulator [Pirellulaceae bacterium]|nr:TraR/DksA family transcriptional regulator [Planctomycetales bacterium]
MNRKEAIADLREILTKRREAIRMALTGDTSLLHQLASEMRGDVCDMALDTVEDELSSQLIEVESRELAMIENALKLMNTGEYGVCEACETPIPLARLQALPYATLCIQCQRQSEMAGGGYSRSADWSRVIDYAGDDVKARDVDMNVT